MTLEMSLCARRPQRRSDCETGDRHVMKKTPAPNTSGPQLCHTTVQTLNACCAKEQHRFHFPSKSHDTLRRFPPMQVVTTEPGGTRRIKRTSIPLSCVGLFVWRWSYNRTGSGKQSKYGICTCKPQRFRLRSQLARRRFQTIFWETVQSNAEDHRRAALKEVIGSAGAPTKPVQVFSAHTGTGKAGLGGWVWDSFTLFHRSAGMFWNSRLCLLCF